MSEKFQKFMERALAVLSTLMSSHLGDRTKYIGSSDVAGCGRKAALKRLQPRPSAKTVAEAMLLALGHAIEDTVAKIFEAGGCKNIRREVEYVHPEFPWLKTHVDFLAETPAEIRIRELKSTKGEPSTPYETWDNQTTFQVGMVAINNPMKSVVGSLMVVDRICGGIKEFNGYAFNKVRFDSLVAKAQKIWAAIQGEGELPHSEPGMLCGKCPYQSECPAHNTDGLPVIPEEIAGLVSEFFVINERMKLLKKESDHLRDMIYTYSGKKYFKGVTEEGLLLYVKEQKGKLSIDTEKLEKQYPEAYNSCKKIGQPFTKVEVSSARPAEEGGAE